MLSTAGTGDGAGCPNTCWQIPRSSMTSAGFMPSACSSSKCRVQCWQALSLRSRLRSTKYLRKIPGPQPCPLLAPGHLRALPLGSVVDPSDAPSVGDAAANDTLGIAMKYRGRPPAGQLATASRFYSRCCELNKFGAWLQVPQENAPPGLQILH